jgi:hypothetical protein
VPARPAGLAPNPVAARQRGRTRVRQ